MRRNKISSFLLSLVIAFGLWLYVVTTVSTEGDTTIYDIPVQFESETALEQRGLMITSGTDAAIDLRLSGARTHLNKLTNSNITVKVDLSRIYDPGVHQVSYDIIYPGDVPSNAVTEQNKNPDAITITVEKRETKPIPVIVVYSGSVPEDYLDDRDNVLLDHETISIEGPASVVEQVDHAEIYVDLEGRTESISESYKYTLCDAAGEPVDAAMITAETAEVRLDMTIQRFKKLPVTYELVEGGGATQAYTKITIDTPEIPVSGSSAILEELTEINLGVINLAQITEDTVLPFTINLPEGVTNLTGVDEVNVEIEFSGLATREFTVEDIRVVGVPLGWDYELATKRLVITVRGPRGVINQMTAEDLVVTADFSGKEVGAHIVNAAITVSDSTYEAVGALGTYSVSATLREHAEEETN